MCFKGVEFAQLACLIYILGTFLLFLMCGIEVTDWTKESQNKISYPTTFMNQVSADWSFAPYTSFVATNNTNCPTTAPAQAMGRRFYGTNLGCDCLGIYSKYITGDNSMIPGTACNWNQTKYGCQNCPPINTIRQSVFNGTMICASQNAIPFINATRLDQNQTCPAGMSPCSTFTSLQSTTCVATANITTNCPVTDL